MGVILIWDRVGWFALGQIIHSDPVQNDPHLHVHLLVMLKCFNIPGTCTLYVYGNVNSWKYTKSKLTQLVSRDIQFPKKYLLCTCIIFSLDLLLEEGVYTSEVTEIVGGIAAGKTQVNIIFPLSAKWSVKSFFLHADLKKIYIFTVIKN